VLCGPSHSGKSTFAKKLGQHFRVISSDAVRQQLTGRSGPCGREDEVWGTFETMRLKALEQGRSVVLDACHMSREARWHSLQGAKGRHKKVCVVFDLPLAVVLARCREAGRLPPKEVERMWRAFQATKPTPAKLRREGYDEVYVVTE
jgi:predicted kinase